MQVIVDRTQLLSALKRAGAAVVQGQQAYQAAVLFIADEGGPMAMSLSATTGTLRVKTDFMGDIKISGRSLLNHRALTSRIVEMPEGNVELTVDHKLKVSIRSLASKRKLAMTAHEHEIFPPIPPASGDPICQVEAKILQQTAAEVAFVIDKAYTDGALLAPTEGGKFRLVTFSSRGMAVATGWFYKGQEGTAGESVLLPRALLEAASVLTADATVLEVTGDEHRVTLKAPGTMISCDKLTQTMTPVWERVLASAPAQKRFKVPASRLLESVKAVSVAADVVEGAERFLQIDIRYKSPDCVVSTRASQNNFGEDELSILDPSDGAFTVHLDGALLSHALRSFGPDDTDLYYDVVGGQDAFVLKSQSLLMMLMPVSDTKAKA